MASNENTRSGGMQSKLLGKVGKKIEEQLTKKFGGVRCYMQHPVPG